METENNNVSVMSAEEKHNYNGITIESNGASASNDNATHHKSYYKKYSYHNGRDFGFRFIDFSAMLPTKFCGSKIFALIFAAIAFLLFIFVALPAFLIVRILGAIGLSIKKLMKL